MVALDALSLPSGLVWEDEFAFQPATQSVLRTLDGGLVVFSGILAQGRPITLEARIDQGWLTRSQVEALAMMAGLPGQTFSLDFRNQIWTVMFRHHEPPAFEAESLIYRNNPAPGDFYTGRIKLMTL